MRAAHPSTLRAFPQLQQRTRNRMDGIGKLRETTTPGKPDTPEYPLQRSSLPNSDRSVPKVSRTSPRRFIRPRQSLQNVPQSPRARPFHLRAVCLANCLSCDENHVGRHARCSITPPECLTQKSFGSISCHRATYPSACHHTHSQAPEPCGSNEGHEERTHHAPSLAIGLLEILPSIQSLALSPLLWLHTARRRRPLRRRRERTDRPPLERIRTRKP